MSEPQPKELHYRMLENLAKDVSSVRRTTFKALLRGVPPMLSTFLRGDARKTMEMLRVEKDLLKLIGNCIAIESRIFDYLEDERKPFLALLRDLAVPAFTGITAYWTSTIAKVNGDPEMRVTAISLAGVGLIIFVLKSKNRESFKRNLEDTERLEKLNEAVEIMKVHKEKMEKAFGMDPKE